MKALHSTCQPCAGEAGATAGLAEFLGRHRRLFVLTGAGCSTASGIPAYRDREGRWLGANPIQHAEFVNQPGKRQRYWARSFAGWPRVEGARPNAAHDALATLERLGHVRQLVTQNVDGLHQRAGSRRVIDLHGRLDQVDCLSCGQRESRCTFQARLAQLNPQHAGTDGRSRPDGDTEVDPAAQMRFQIPDCAQCGGVMKPNVVFFGANVPRARVERAREKLRTADGMLVVGSSLKVFSGYRFILQAVQQQIPIALVNIGRTRADGLVPLRFQGACDRLLPQALATLCGTARRGRLR